MVVERQPWMYRAGEHPGDDREYLELLTRVVFAAGLGPRVVASRWEGMRELLGGFDAQHLASLQPTDVDRLLADTRMIRNRRKIEATVRNAQAFQALVAEQGGFAAYLDAQGIGEGFEGAVQDLISRFEHLGATSAVLFLFSAGWRERPEPVDPEATARETASPETGENETGEPEASEPRVVAAGSRGGRRRT